MNLDGKSIAAIAHTAVVLLVVFGVISSGDSAAAQAELAKGITAAAGLVSSGVVFWKYIHHHGETKP